ncbi:type II secretion system F family protein (plasmid) [Dyella sp. BiH032]|uniref:type II secretion system F family protein n=1 Tax=Dyella sp. BiH032 TaxID=3075430 RepID=UPI00289331F6|nr:type II secretion system F family protein [Dyella sp. BiH032]WNL48552.1 type II secretion system F family protein [Dyella sp. BiH032]
MAFEGIKAWAEDFRANTAVDSQNPAMAWLQDRIIRLQFGVDTRIQLYDDLALLLSNGVTLIDALDKLYEIHSQEGTKPTEPLAIVCDTARTFVKDGESLSDALSRWVSTQEVILLQAAEEAGELKEVFPRMVWALTEQRELSRRLRKILMYPAVLWLVSYLSFMVIGYFVVPQLLDMLPYEKWLGNTKRMIAVGLFVQNNTALSIGLILAGFVYFRWALPNQIGSSRATLDRLPVFNIYRLNQGITFMVAMATMLPSGISVERALVIIGEGSAKYLANIMEATVDRVRTGDKLGLALYNTEMNFPDRKTVGSLMLISDQVGFEYQLEKYTKRWLELNVRQLEAAANVLRTLALIVIVFASILMGLGSTEVGNSLKAALRS